MFKIIIRKIVEILFPYSCRYCSRRFRRMGNYHKHYLECENRYLDKYVSKIVGGKLLSRSERRRLAKRNGQIKDWKYLNGG